MTAWEEERSPVTGRTRRRYNWDELERQYVEGTVDDQGNRLWYTMDEVAELNGVPSNRLREKAARDHWRDRKAAFQVNLEKQRQELRAKAMEQEAVEVDRQALTTAKLGLRLIGVRIGEIAKDAQEAQRQRTAEPEGFRLPSMDSREVETLARAATAWHGLAARALGEIPTTRTEITGVGGDPLQIDARVTPALQEGDPDRIAAFVLAVERAGLGSTPAGALVAAEAAEPEEEGDPS